jgi:hypothetical protein
MTVDHRIIDGQQRLITISLVLAAIKQRIRAYPPTARRTREIEEIDRLLTNPGSSASESVKVIPYGDDFAPYVECVEGGQPSEGQIAAASEFFATKLAELRENRLIAMRDGMAGRFYFAAVYLDDVDDANRIFRSLNEAGLTLAPTDHIRNNLFMSAGTAGDALYVAHWEPLERLLGSNEALLSFLFAEQARQPHHPNTIRKNQLHRVYADRFAEFAGSRGRMKTYLESVQKNGTMFKAIHEPDRLVQTGLTTHSRVGPDVRRLAEWNSQPAEIAILDILVKLRDGEIQLSQATRALHSVESFLVRRFLAGERANLLSRIFTDLVAQFPETGTYSARLRAALSHLGHSWPTAQEVQRSVTTLLNFYNQGAAPQRRYVLKQLDGHFLDRGVLKRDEISRAWPADLTIEHIMPQSLDDAWRDDLEHERRAEGWSETVEELHEAHVNLLGNLTLARQGRNTQYANKPYGEKIALINQEMPIRLNAELGTGPYRQWGILAIRRRSGALATLSNAIWEGPVGR